MAPVQQQPQMGTAVEIIIIRPLLTIHLLSLHLNPIPPPPVVLQQQQRPLAPPLIRGQFDSLALMIALAFKGQLVS